MDTGKLARKFTQGYGFVSVDSGGPNIFICNRMVGSLVWDALKVGDRLSFSVIRCEKGVECSNVKVLPNDNEEIEHAE